MNELLGGGLRSGGVLFEFYLIFFPQCNYERGSRAVAEVVGVIIFSRAALNQWLNHLAG